MSIMAAMILLKLFINDNERCHTTGASKCMSRTLFSFVNKMQSIILEDQKNINNVKKNRM